MKVSEMERTRRRVRRKGIDVASLAGAICAAAGVELDDLYSPARRRPVIVARFALCLALNAQGVGPTDIGRLIGRHHTTVAQAIERGAGDQAVVGVVQGLVAGGIGPVTLAPLNRLPAGDRLRVAAYLRTLQLGTPIRGEAFVGLVILAHMPKARELAIQTLHLARMGEHAWRIAEHARQIGLTWKEG